MIKLFTSFLVLLASIKGFSQIILVTTSSALQSALNNAQPGNIITIAPGTYTISGGFKVPAGINGTSSNPIQLVGTKKSIISSNNITANYGLYLQGNSYWVLKGFTVRNSAKCIMLDYSSHNTIDSVTILRSGSEALHLRRFSSHNTVSNCFIDSTGKNPSDSINGYAEGIYVGSANSNWTTYTAGNPDTCNFNTFHSNVFGNDIQSENIDVKEGTRYGVLTANTFSGLGCNGKNSADSYIDVKGDHYLIQCNVGGNNGPNIVDGFQSHVNKLTAGTYGDFNNFSGNTIDMAGVGTTSGYAINVEVRASAGVIHNIVCSNNVVIHPVNGLSKTTVSTTCGTVTCFTNNAPTVTITSSLTSPTNISLIPLIITFSETVSGFLVSDITVSGGTLGSVSGSGKNYTATITPTGPGTITAQIVANAATDLSGNGNTLSPTFNIVFDNVSPTVPTHVTAINTTATGTQLVWGASADNIGMAGYEVFEDGNLLENVTSTSILISGLLSGSSYTFTVRAKDVAGNLSSLSSNVVVLTKDTISPSIPTNLIASGTSVSGTTLTWAASSDNVGIENYEVFQNGNLVATVTSTSINISGLISGNSYSYTVLSEDVSGNKSAQSIGVTVTTLSNLVTQILGGIIESSVRIYPNPLSSVNELTIETNETLLNGQLEIQDIQGRKIFSQHISQTVSHVHYRFNPGIYFVRLLNGDASIIKLLIVE